MKRNYGEPQLTGSIKQTGGNDNSRTYCSLIQPNNIGMAVGRRFAIPTKYSPRRKKETTNSSRKLLRNKCYPLLLSRGSKDTTIIIVVLLLSRDGQGLISPDVSSACVMTRIA